MQAGAAANVEKRQAIEALAPAQALQVDDGLRNARFVDLRRVVEPVLAEREMGLGLEKIVV